MLIPVLATFLLCFALDWVWVWYTKAVANHRQNEATFWSGIIMLITGFNITEIAQHWYLVLVAASGAALGTWTALSREVDEGTEQ